MKLVAKLAQLFSELEFLVGGGKTGLYKNNSVPCWGGREPAAVCAWFRAGSAHGVLGFVIVDISFLTTGKCLNTHVRMAYIDTLS